MVAALLAGARCCQHRAAQAGATGDLFEWIGRSGGSVAGVMTGATPLGYGLVATQVSRAV